MGRRPLSLVYQCERSFDDLEGRDPVRRRCAACRLDVVDLRAFTEEEQERYLELADVGHEEICAVVPLASEEVASCRKHPESIRPARGPVVVGRVDPRSASQKRWDDERAGVMRGGGASRVERLAELERRAAAARAEMLAILEGVRRRT